MIGKASVALEFPYQKNTEMSDDVEPSSDDRQKTQNNTTQNTRRRRAATVAMVRVAVSRPRLGSSNKAKFRRAVFDLFLSSSHFLLKHG